MSRATAADDSDEEILLSPQSREDELMMALQTIGIQCSLDV
jgi:hypothetical protein